MEQEREADQRRETMPRVSASANMSAVHATSFDGAWRHATPDVSVDANFDLGDHDAALAALECCVERVKAQIARATA